MKKTTSRIQHNPFSTFVTRRSGKPFHYLHDYVSANP